MELAEVQIPLSGIDILTTPVDLISDSVVVTAGPATPAAQ